MNPDTSACPLCGARSAEARFSERGFQLVQCRGCELFYINPYPTDAAETHETVATYDYAELEIVDPQRHYRSSQRYYERYFDWLEPELVSARRVLDVGCGTGRLLELLGARENLHREGIELNKQRAAFSRSVAACPVHEVPLEELDPETPFDVLFMMNVLSHVSQLEPFFAAIRQVMTDDGRLVMKVGEMDGRVKKSAVNDWSLPDHLHFLGLNTIDVLADRFGFRVARHQREPLSWEIFAKEAWVAPGRSRLRNVIKRTVVSVPYTLPAMRKVYDAVHGDTIFTSLVVLVPK